jgi:hypothetical protein
MIEASLPLYVDMSILTIKIVYNEKFSNRDPFGSICQ